MSTDLFAPILSFGASLESRSVRCLLKLGSRTSPLAMTQTRIVRAALAQAHRPCRAPRRKALCRSCRSTTTGDRILDRRLAESGGKGLFTKELDEALLDGRIDVAIHSMKDVPTLLPGGAGHRRRAAARRSPRCSDQPRAKTVKDLPQAQFSEPRAPGARRRRFISARFEIVLLRGNVDTRLDKVESGEIDATFLAQAGLNRLGRSVEIAHLVEATDIPPAAGQGALAMMTRTDDARSRDAAAHIGDEAARIEITAERAFLEALDGSADADRGFCQSAWRPPEIHGRSFVRWMERIAGGDRPICCAAKARSIWRALWSGGRVGNARRSRRSVRPGGLMAILVTRAAPGPMRPLSACAIVALKSSYRRC